MHCDCVVDRRSYDDLCQHKRAIVQINQCGRDCSDLYLGAKTLLEDAPSNMHTAACWNIVGKRDFFSIARPPPKKNKIEARHVSTMDNIQEIFKPERFYFNQIYITYLSCCKSTAFLESARTKCIFYTFLNILHNACAPCHYNRLGLKTLASRKLQVTPQLI